MSTGASLLARLRRSTRGAAIVELGLIAMPACVVLLVLTDLGYRMYLNSVVEGTVHRAARMATIGDKTTEEIDIFVQRSLRSFSHYAEIDIEKKSYYQYSGVGKPEKIKQDIAPLGSYNVGDCYEDTNNNGSYDLVAGRLGMGSADDVVYYKVTAEFPRIVPLGKFMGWSDKEKVSANTLLRNQPYSAQTVPAVKCD